MIHSDLHEPKVPGAFECLSTMVACVEPALVDPVCGESPGNMSILEQNYSKAKFIVRLKRRNGRVKHLVRLCWSSVLFFFHSKFNWGKTVDILVQTLPVQYENLYIEGNDIKFDSAPSVSIEVNQSLVPKVSSYTLDLRSIKYCRVPLMLLLFTNIGCCWKLWWVGSTGSVQSWAVREGA